MFPMGKALLTSMSQPATSTSCCTLSACRDAANALSADEDLRSLAAAAGVLSNDRYLRSLAGGEVSQALLLDAAGNLWNCQPLWPNILQHLVGCSLDGAQPKASWGNKGDTAGFIFDDVLSLCSHLGLAPGLTPWLWPLLP